MAGAGRRRAHSGKLQISRHQLRWNEHRGRCVRSKRVHFDQYRRDVYFASEQRPGLRVYLVEVRIRRSSKREKREERSEVFPSVFFLPSSFLTSPLSLLLSKPKTTENKTLPLRSLAMSSDGSKVATGLQPGNLWLKSGAANWTAASGLPTNATQGKWYSLAMSSNGSIIYAAAQSSNIWKSTDSGSSWSRTSAPVQNW